MGEAGNPSRRGPPRGARGAEGSRGPSRPGRRGCCVLETPGRARGAATCGREGLGPTRKRSRGPERVGGEERGRSGLGGFQPRLPRQAQRPPTTTTPAGHRGGDGGGEASPDPHTGWGGGLPRHIPSLTATKKRRPHDPGGAPVPSAPQGGAAKGGSPRGRGAGALEGGGPHSSTPSLSIPPPGGWRQGRGCGASGLGGAGGSARRGHSRLERVLNGRSHGPLCGAASGPGRCCRRARALPGLRRPLCRPARYDFIHSWGCGASGAGRAGGGAQPIPAPPGAPRDVESGGARLRPRAPLPGLHVPGGVRRTARPLAARDTGWGSLSP